MPDDAWLRGYDDLPRFDPDPGDGERPGFLVSLAAILLLAIPWTVGVCWIVKQVWNRLG